jgi:hypothetical protein
MLPLSTTTKISVQHLPKFKWPFFVTLTAATTNSYTSSSRADPIMSSGVKQTGHADPVNNIF